MAIYTKLEFAEIEALIRPLQLGRLLAARGVTAGVENTTYFLNFETNTNAGVDEQFVLTIAETLSNSDIEFIAQLTTHLNRQGLPVPAPINAQSALSIRGKPALLIPKISGHHPEVATPELCHSLGELIGKLHLAAMASNFEYESHRSLSWVQATGNAVLPRLDTPEQNLLKQELIALVEFVSANNEMPQAIIHGDLFRDNVLTKDSEIVAVIDFFSAGTGYLLLDLAIAVNDWCIDSECAVGNDQYRALLEGYSAVRPPSASEINGWPQFLRIAALRFWVSRLSEQLFGSIHAPAGRGKNPTPYQSLISFHNAYPLTWAF